MRHAAAKTIVRPISLIVAFLIASAPLVAAAGGMSLPARGARPLGRAGSFVAGADDLEAVYYNPAGLAGTGHLSAMIDVGLVLQQVHYDRVDSGGVKRPGVDDDNGIVPIPFLGVSWRPEALGRRFTFAFAAFVPYSGIPRYKWDGPQRYSLVSLGGTALAVAELAVAFRITPQLYIGAGFQNMFFSISNKTTLSSCTQLNCAPEDPRFDSPTQTKASSMFTPSGNVGALYVHRLFRIGLSLQLPYFIRASGTVASQLPSDPQFTGATVCNSNSTNCDPSGNWIDVNMNLPLVLRAGVEARPTNRVRVELGFDYEAWSMQDQIRFIPHGVYIDHVIGVGRYVLKPMMLDRSMKDTYSVHIGGEVDVIPHLLTARAGYLFESSAVPDETLSVITPDGNKHLLALGGGVHFGRFRVDAAYAHVFQGDRTVTTSRSLQLNPIQPALAVPVGNGKYAVSNDILSVGLEARF